jgi:hypothetical protein
MGQQALQLQPAVQLGKVDPNNTTTAETSVHICNAGHHLEQHD